jgi:hypothetical protein
LNPVIDFSLSYAILFGDKKGVLYKAQVSGVTDQLQAHHGSFCLYPHEKVWTVGSDGFVRCFDFELAKEKGRRLYSHFLSPVYCSTGSKDIILIVHRLGMSVMNVVTKECKSITLDGQDASLRNVAYCCTIAENVGYVGWGDGSLTVLDLKTMEQRRQRTALKNAIRSILVSDQILISGDDGQVLTLHKR